MLTREIVISDVDALVVTYYIECMANRIANGTEIGFDFCLERVSLRDPIERRTGRGIVVDGQIYSVWPCPGYAVRVTESPNYKAGEVVAITSLSVRP